MTSTVTSDAVLHTPTVTADALSAPRLHQFAKILHQLGLYCTFLPQDAKMPNPYSMLHIIAQRDELSVILYGIESLEARQIAYDAFKGIDIMFSDYYECNKLMPFSHLAVFGYFAILMACALYVVIDGKVSAEVAQEIDKYQRKWTAAQEGWIKSYPLDSTTANCVRQLSPFLQNANTPAPQH